MLQHNLRFYHWKRSNITNNILSALKNVGHAKSQKESEESQKSSGARRTILILFNPKAFVVCSL